MAITLKPVSDPADRTLTHACAMPHAWRRDGVNRAAVVGFFNQKGGCAKTTTTHNLGVLLAKDGHKVLLVDFEPQKNLTQSFLLDAVPRRRAYDVLVDRNGGDFGEALIPTPITG